MRLCAAKLEQGEVPLFDMRPAELLLELGKKLSVFNNTVEHIEDQTDSLQQYTKYVSPPSVMLAESKPDADFLRLKIKILY